MSYTTADRNGNDTTLVFRYNGTDLSVLRVIKVGDKHILKISSFKNIESIEIQLKLYNSISEMLYSNSIQYSDSIEMDMTAFPQGVYFVRVIIGGRAGTVKFLK